MFSDSEDDDEIEEEANVGDSAASGPVATGGVDPANNVEEELPEEGRPQAAVVVETVETHVGDGIIVASYPAEAPVGEDNGPVMASYPAELPSGEEGRLALETAREADGPIVASYPAVGTPRGGYEPTITSDHGPSNADDEAAYPAVAPYPAYPTDDNDADAAYPEVAPYSLNDGGEYYAGDDVDAAYPVTDDYPGGDAYPVTDDYPGGDVTDEYPVTDAYSRGGEQVSSDEPPAYPTEHLLAEEDDGATEKPQQPPKKKFKADSAVVAFLPSHLRKKRPTK